jgi:hypothetical protein
MVLNLQTSVGILHCTYSGHRHESFPKTFEKNVALVLSPEALSFPRARRRFYLPDTMLGGMFSTCHFMGGEGRDACKPLSSATLTLFALYEQLTKLLAHNASLKTARYIFYTQPDGHHPVPRQAHRRSCHPGLPLPLPEEAGRAC